jgi:hypothetical protein
MVWKKGQSGNPAGKVKGHKDRLKNNFLKALADDFVANGKDAIVRMRTDDPSGYIRAIASLMPKEMDLNHNLSPLAELTDEQLQTVVDTTERILNERASEIGIAAEVGEEEPRLLQ